MPIFEPAIPETESPDLGHEEESAVENENEFEESEQNFATKEQDIQDDEEADDSPSEQERGEELLAGKYKSTDDLVKGYKELEKQFHQQRQQAQSNQSAAPQTPTNQVDYNEMFWEQFRENPLGTMQTLLDMRINKELSPIHEQRQSEVLTRNLDDVAKEYPQMRTEEGFSALHGKVKEIAAELGNPDLASNPSPRVLRMAASELFGDTKAQLYQKAKNAGRQEAETARRSKQGLNATGVTKQKSDTPKSEEELIRESIVNAGRRGGIFG